MSDLTHVRVEWEAEVAIVTIDRQDKLNALNAEVVAEIGDVFSGLRDDDDVRGVILTGAGDKAFVAGADIGELAMMDAVSGVDVSRDGQDVFRSIERFPKPVLAAVGGYALGAVPWRLVVMGAAPALHVLLFERFRRRGISSGHCIGLTWIGAGLLTVYCAWVAVGLPLKL